VRLQVQRPELVHADHHGRILRLRLGLAIGDRVQLQHPVLLGLVIRIGAGLPGLHSLKADALLLEQQA
jgi:hypothetical protein